ncbi:MAG: glycosyltransferase [Acidobacteriota bacterium]
MSTLLDRYAEVAGEDVVMQLRQLSASMRGMKVVHVNSTKEGGGVAEILHRLVPLQQELGLDVSWEIITGPPDFYECTKRFHNALQGNRIDIPDHLLRVFEETNRQNMEMLRDRLEEADFVFIHDPQPAPLLRYLPHRRGKWIWRCHIDVSHPYRPVWRYLRPFVDIYDAAVWSLAAFVRPMSPPAYLIAPSIDPLSEKNIDLDPAEVESVYSRFGIDPRRPLIVQVSRFDRFKDPIGVIQAYRMARSFKPLQLVLAGGGASDDPEGAAMLAEVEAAVNGDPDIHVLLLPPDAHRTINALQRAADIVLQKSTKEGFGLTVTEAMWKGKPVIGGNTGGIRLQVIDHQTGFLVSTPEGAALRIRYLLHRPEKREAMGKRARNFVKHNFLLTRQLGEYLTVMLTMMYEGKERIECSGDGFENVRCSV